MSIKVLVFGEEQEEREDIRRRLDIPQISKVDFAEGVLTSENASQTKGYELVWLITNSIIGEKESAELERYGVKYIVTRSAGFDHLDISALKRHNICAANVPEYSPGAISEHTVLLLLAMIRQLKRQIQMTESGNFTLNGILGKELADMTVGIIGAGRIGSRTIQILRGFGCTILVYTLYPDDSLASMVTYTNRDDLLEHSDAVIFHCPLTGDNYHELNQETIDKMKKGAVLINTARGGLVDARAVLDSLEKGKLGGFAFDVYENEDKYIRTVDPKYDDEIFWKLTRRDDVIYTAHTAFYTKEATEQLIRVTVENVISYASHRCCRNEITEKGAI